MQDLHYTVTVTLTVTKRVWCEQTHTYIHGSTEQNRGPRNRPMKICPVDFDKGAKAI